MSVRVGHHQTIHASGITVVGHHNTVHGNNNTITGHHNSIHGNNNTVTGHHNSIHGTGNKQSGDYNKMNGKQEGGSTPKGSGSVVVNTFGGGQGVITHVFHNHPGSIIGSVGDDDDDKKEKKKEKKKKEKRKHEEEEEEVVFIECPLESDKDVPLPEDAAEGVPSCVVCTANAPCCVVMPCMHKSLCCACSRVLTGEGTKARGEVKCPLCQGEVHKIAKVFE